MPRSSSSTRRRRPINIENDAMKLLTFFYTLLNKQEKKYLKKEVKDMGKKNNSEIVEYMNGLIINQRGGAGSSIGGSKSSLMIFVLLLVSLLYLNTRVGANTLTDFTVPKVFENFDMVSTKEDKKSTFLDDSHTWKNMIAIIGIGTPSDVKRIYTEIDNILIKEQWTGLQAIYPGEAAVFEPYYNLYKADGCMISESASALAPYRFGLESKEVIPKVFNQLNVLKDAGALSNDDYEKLGKIATTYILQLPPDKLTNKIVCDMQKHTMIALMSKAVSNRLAKETQAQLESKPKFTEPESKAEVNDMFKQLIDFFKGNYFIIVLLGIFGLGYLIFNKKIGKSKTVNIKNKIKINKPAIKTPENKGIEMLRVYKSSSSDDEKAPAQAPAPRVQEHSRTHITADVTSQDARALGLPIQFGTTKGNNRKSPGRKSPGRKSVESNRIQGTKNTDADLNKHYDSVSRHQAERHIR